MPIDPDEHRRGEHAEQGRVRPARASPRRDIDEPPRHRRPRAAASRRGSRASPRPPARARRPASVAPSGASAPANSAAHSPSVIARPAWTIRGMPPTSVVNTAIAAAPRSARTIVIRRRRPTAVISGHTRPANASSWCAIDGANSTIATPTAATRGTSPTAGSWICVNAPTRPVITPAISAATSNGAASSKASSSPSRTSAARLCVTAYPRSRLSISSRQPSTETNSSSLSGNETTCGDVVCSPSAASPSPTTRSITRNGMKISTAIANASRSSVVRNAGARTHSSSPRDARCPSAPQGRRTSRDRASWHDVRGTPAAAEPTRTRASTLRSARPLGTERAESRLGVDRRASTSARADPQAPAWPRAPWRRARHGSRGVGGGSRRRPCTISTATGAITKNVRISDDAHHDQPRRRIGRADRVAQQRQHHRHLHEARQHQHDERQDRDQRQQRARCPSPPDVPFTASMQARRFGCARSARRGGRRLGRPAAPCARRLLHACRTSSPNVGRAITRARTSAPSSSDSTDSPISLVPTSSVLPATSTTYSDRRGSSGNARDHVEQVRPPHPAGREEPPDQPHDDERRDTHAAEHHQRGHQQVAVARRRHTIPGHAGCYQGRLTATGAALRSYRHPPRRYPRSPLPGRPLRHGPGTDCAATRAPAMPRPRHRLRRYPDTRYAAPRAQP